MKKITKKQFEIVSFIQDYIGKHEISPTLYEIAGHFSIRPSTAAAHIAALERKHAVKRQKGARRSIRPAGPKRGHDAKNSVCIPLYAKLSCFPNAPSARYCVDSGLLPDEAAPADLFALRSGVFRDQDRTSEIAPGDILIVWTRPGPLRPGMMVLERRESVPVFRTVAAATLPERDTLGRVVAVLRSL